MPDLNAATIEAAMSMIAGTARSMGIVVGRVRQEGRDMFRGKKVSGQRKADRQGQSV